MNQPSILTDFYLITGNEGEERPSETVIKEFEKAIAGTHSVKVLKSDSYYISRFFYKLWKSELTFRFFHLFFLILKAIIYRKSKNYFVVLMGPRFPKCFPFFFGRGEKAIYLFDAWPSYYKIIIRFINDFKTDFVFVSSKQSAENLNQLLGRKKVFWIPEGINPEGYNVLPYENRDIDVLAFGRKYEDFHQKIADSLKQENINYLFASGNEKIFQDNESFVDGLSRTKISVCFPTSLTHPQRAENIETMTNRYLQSMASKCIILGKAPGEMIELFGYNPVIEADLDNPAEQIKEILNNFSQFDGLIEMNYKNVVEKHAWLNRWENISSIISEENNF